MTPGEFEEAVTWMEIRWGSLQKGWTDVATIYGDFQHFPAADLTAALAQLYGTGLQTCPAPSKLMKILRERAQASSFDVALLESEPCEKHRWGILAEHPDGSRDAICGRCKDTNTFPPGRLWTATELEDGVNRAPVEPDAY